MTGQKRADKGACELFPHWEWEWWPTGRYVTITIPEKGDARTPGSCPGHEVDLTPEDLRAMLAATGEGDES